MNKSIENWTRKEFLNLPHRKWSEDSIYDSIVLVPTGKKHDSEFMLIAVIGVVDNEPKEIASYCDDICYHFKQPVEEPRYAIRTDSYFPSGLMHVWSWYYKFIVGTATSSTDITLVKKEK